MAVHADTDDLCIKVLEAAEFCFIGGKLSGTYLAKTVWDKGKHNILFAAEIAEMP